MTFTDIVRGVALESVRAIKSPDGKEHYFIFTETGCVIYVRPKDRLVRNIYSYPSDNAAFVFTYSHTKNAAYIFHAGVVLVQIELDTLIVKTFNPNKYLENYVNHFRTPVKATTVPHYVMPATDGNVWFAPIRTYAVPNMVKFDTTTEEFSTEAFFVDPETEFSQGFRSGSYRELTTGPSSLHGIYTGFRMTDDFQDLTQTIISEYESSGLAILKNNRFSISLHWDDRDIASITRRVIIHNGAWRIVDLKSITNQIVSPGTGLGFDSHITLNDFVDNLGTPVDMSTFASKTSPSFASVTGTTTASFDMSLFYARTQFIGRFPYQIEGRSSNSQYFVFAYSPTTGLPLYPNSFDKNAGYFTNSRESTTYWANMPMAQGFSGSNEFILFLKNSSGDWGYYRPDTEAFVLYDPIANPSGYSLVEVDLNDPDDPNSDGFYCSLFTENEGIIDFLGEEWVQAAGFNSAVNPTFGLAVDSIYNRAELTVEFTPDSTSDIVLSDTVEGINTATGNISSAIEVNTGEFVFGGAAYTGISVGKDVAGDYVSTGFFGNRSLYTSEIFNGRVFFGGYLGKFDTIDYSDIDNPIYHSVIWSINQYVFSMAVRADALVASGVGVRRPNYENNYMKIGFIKTDFTESRFGNLPKILDVQETIALRNAVGLSAGDYTIDNAHPFLVAYASSNGLTWTQLKDLFTSTTPYKAIDTVCYDFTILVQLTHNGISGLRGLNIYEDISGVGSFIDSDFGRSTHYPKVMYVEKTDITLIAEPDYKLVEIQALGYRNDFGIAMFTTDTYVCFLFNEGTDLVVRCVSKSNMERAAEDVTPITVLDKVITIPKGTANGSWGYLQATGSNPYRRIGFGLGDDLYVTISDTAIVDTDPAVALKIDIDAETWEVFMTASDDSIPTTMTYNATTDNVLATRGSTAKLFEDKSILSLPLTY